MKDAVVIFYLASIVGGLWGVVRILRYAFGKHKRRIHISGTTWVASVVGVYLSFSGFIGFANTEKVSMRYGISADYTLLDFPWIDIFVILWALSHILIMCKSVRALMKTREKLIDDITPEMIIEATDKIIIEKDLVGDEWVSSTWNKISQSDWIKRLGSKPALLKQTLDNKLRVTASSPEPYAEWVDLIQHFVYLEERDSINSSA